MGQDKTCHPAPSGLAVSVPPSSSAGSRSRPIP